MAASIMAHIQERVERRSEATSRVLRELAPQIQSAMQANAAWKDRTGEARRTLTATVDTTRVGGGRERHSEWDLVLAYGVPYGRWLETVNGPAMGHRAGMSDAELMERKNAGNFAILWPTMDAWRPRVRSAVRAARASA